MKNIILTVSYGSHTDCLTNTQKTTWSDLCASIFDCSQLSVTQLYYRDREGDIIAFSSDDELDSLKRSCTTGWLHLSTDPTNTIRWVLDDSFVNQKGDLEQSSIAPAAATHSSSTPIQSSKAPTTETPRTDNTTTTTSFTFQFEQFGKLMDKYNDLIQQDEQVKALMHQTATEITLQQKSTVDLAELENRLAIYNQGKTSVNNALYPLRSKLSSGASIGLSRSATSVTPKKNIKRTPTAVLHRDHDKSNDQSWLAPTTRYPDVPPPSYELHHQPNENEKWKREQRRHTHYGNFDHHSFPSSSWGEWPAYSSLHPQPPPSQGTNDTLSSTFSSATPTPSTPKLHGTLPTSVPSSSPESPQHNHHHTQRPPMSLYPRPPILPALLKRTSRLLSHWVPPLNSPATPPLPPRLSSNGTALRSTSAMNDDSILYNDNDYGDSKHYPSTSNCDDRISRSKQKGKQHDDTAHIKDQPRYSDPAAVIRNRQICKEQQRTLRQQQKELARTRRRLKRQEKQDRREQRRQRRQGVYTHSTTTNNNNPLPHEQNGISLQHDGRRRRRRQDSSSNDNNSRLDGGQRTISSSYGANSSSLRKSSSLSSISTLSSQSACSSTSTSASSSSSSSTHALEKSHQQQSSGLLDPHAATLQYPTIPTSLTQYHCHRHYQPSSLGNNDHLYGRQFRNGEDDDQSLDAHDVEYLANTFNQLSTTNGDPPLVPRKQ